ncbi:unnamed protein product [Rotaria magnacalcarata]|uniref:Acetylserotonin O-methyltransferase n=1 Tax=Rotaria magnacalcarata TaxID=392030 RepID=A0A816TN98_9BILA|nr:unnamed protein product [Rotaria magnacalcarata]CAF4170849.1 unnamed protein product [Rotaria magnacalcarata]
MTENHLIRRHFLLTTNRTEETAIWTFAELGVADLLEAANTPQTADELAQKQGWNSDYLYRLLRAVADANIVREIKYNEAIELEKTNRFELTKDGRYLTSDHPSKLRYSLRAWFHPVIQTASQYLPQLIRDGSSKGSGVERVTGNVPIFEFLKKEENREFAHNFNEAMASHSRCSREIVVNAINFSRFNKIVDIGGGLGCLLSYILEKNPTIKQGVCFDLPQVMQQSDIENEFVKQNLSKDRYQLVGGDMFDPKTIPQADAYILQNIIHNWSDDQAIDIIKSIRKAANGQQVTLFIIEVMVISDIEQNKFLSRIVHAMDLQMMIILNGKERTQKQHEYLFEQSGFKFKRLYVTGTPHSIIEAVSN